jgi:Ca-activated chloride channel homolog
MDRQVQSDETAVGFVLIRSPLIWLLLALLIFSVSSTSQAESLATKNRKGNEFYVQGKYAEAENKYLDAQVNNPGNPTVLYNLGNSLIRQKKYDQGIQALKQAIEKGDNRAKGNSWYNKGNALFAMGKYKDSADAFIQALKLDPADKDAKHNLELALMKLKQQQEQKQESKQSKSGEGKQDPENSKGQSAPEKEGRQKPNDQNQVNAEQRQKERNEAEKQDRTQAPRREGAVNKERSLQILDAVQNQETEEQRKLLERRARQQAKGKDW